jgi:hypothetical protein
LYTKLLERLLEQDEEDIFQPNPEEELQQRGSEWVIHIDKNEGGPYGYKTLQRYNTKTWALNEIDAITDVLTGIGLDKDYVESRIQHWKENTFMGGRGMGLTVNIPKSIGLEPYKRWKPHLRKPGEIMEGECHVWTEEYEIKDWY